MKSGRGEEREFTGGNRTRYDRWSGTGAQYRGHVIAFLALIALANGVLGGIHNWLGMAWFSFEFAADFWCIVRAHRMGDWNPMARLSCHRQSAGPRMVLNELVLFGRSGPCSIRARLRLRRLLFVDLRI